MKVITRVGVDLSKSVFYVYGVDKSDNVQLSKSLRRQQFLHFISKLNCCEIVFEACSSSHYWARKVTSFGHQAKLINPAYVKPYVKTNKSDARDAEAICEAASRPNMRFVPVKSITQHDLQVSVTVQGSIMDDHSQPGLGLSHDNTQPVGKLDYWG